MPWLSMCYAVYRKPTFMHLSRTFFVSPMREHALEPLAPITYSSLQSCHLQQVHDLLERSFWSGINGTETLLHRDMRIDTEYTVSDSLDHTPERCTVVATYKRLVVGVAVLSSPRETYITYLAVKAGWDNAGIARYASFCWMDSALLHHRYLVCLPGDRSMLYHLIMLNPNKDITLHVSVNSSAMVSQLRPK